MAGTITGHKHLLSPLSVCYNHHALLCSCMQVNSFIGYSQTDLEVQKDCCLCSFHRLDKTVPVLVSSVTPSHVCTCSHHFHFCVYGLIEEAHRLDIFHPMALDAIFVASLPCCICRTESGEWGMIFDLATPPPLPIPHHPSHSSLTLFTHVQAHPVRCSWSVSSSLLQQSVNKLSLPSP